MRAAALIIAAGLPKCDTVAAAMYKVGAVSCAQNMISTFVKAGVSNIFLVVDEETKKLEKQLSSTGALFLRAEGNVMDSIRQAVSRLPEGFERLFIATADRPLVLPDTLEKMLSRPEKLVIPCYRAKEAPFILLAEDVLPALCNSRNRSFAKAVAELELEKYYLETDDAGLITAPKKAADDKALIEKHQSALLRPVLDISIFGEQTIFDRRLVSLLRLVESVRSIRAACAMTGMSYSIAWNLLNSAEDQLGYALVRRNQGGRSGRGTELTEKGKALLEAYNRFESAMNEKMTALYAECFEKFL